ncbi:MAG: hypothetical protein U0361_12025 [Nitrospiraceae bacterium]
MTQPFAPHDQSPAFVEDNPVDAQLTQDLLEEWAADHYMVVTHAPVLAEGLALLT